MVYCKPPSWRCSVKWAARPGRKGAAVEAAITGRRSSWFSLAAVSGHLTPAGFAGEIRKLARPVRAIAMHLKPPFRDRIAAELEALGLPGLEVGKPGKTYRFGKGQKVKGHG